MHIGIAEKQVELGKSSGLLFAGAATQKRENKQQAGGD
jgi:hypothetical protein